MKGKYFLYIAIAGCFVLHSLHIYGQNIVINEFMSDNESTIRDEDNDFSDWIEIYNNSNQKINLLNYALSDKDDELGKWKFPNIFIQPHDFIIVFASGKNRKDTNQLHTNFRISSDDELYLVNNKGIIINKIEIISLISNESYVRYSDGSDNWYKTLHPTPGDSNIICNQISFSEEGGFYISPFSLILTSLFGDTIFYTLDGSDPTDSSLYYSEPILLNYKYSIPNNISEIPTSPPQSLIGYKAWESPLGIIDKASIVRCASFKNGKRTSKIYTQTYFIDSTIKSKYDIPVISLVTEEKNLFDYDTGIYVPGKYYDVDDPNWTGNYFERGINWEKDVHIEYFSSIGIKYISQNAGLRIHGARSRQCAQKSLRLYAREEYGEKYFNYRLLPHRSNKKYCKFVLQSTMGMSTGNTVIKDVLANEIVRYLNLEFQDYQPVVVFLNGEYWGIHTIRDVIDENYISYLYNIDEDSVDLISTGRRVYAGSSRHYSKLLSFIDSNDMSNKSNYDYIKSQIDVDNYIDYQIAELFLVNIDWPANNTRLWRPQTSNGKWRWILFDLGYGFHDYSYNMLVRSTNDDTATTQRNPPYSTYLFRKLLKNDEFVDQFINRYEELLNNDFSSSQTINKLDFVKQLYSNEIPRHAIRWNAPEDFKDWINDCNYYLLSFLEKRPCGAEKNIIDFFNLSDFGYCYSSINDVRNGELKISSNPNNGVFFVSNSSLHKLKGDFAIYDVTGKIIYQEKKILLEANCKKYFYLNDLPDGMYILHYSNLNTIEKHKIIICR